MSDATMDSLYEEIINDRIAKIDAEMRAWDEKHAGDPVPAIFPMIKDTEHLKLEIRRNELQAVLDDARAVLRLAGREE